VNGAAVGLECLGYAQRIEHTPACARNGTCPAVESGRKSLLRIQWIDDGRRQSMSLEGNGKREPDQAAAEDDDVM
jgi:hypothetical protein